MAAPLDQAATSWPAGPRRPHRSGEIVNFDSLQLYRGFDVGTAKTPVSERRNIPHHLFDVLDPAGGYSAGDYARLARRAIAEIPARGPRADRRGRRRVLSPRAAARPSGAPVARRNLRARLETPGEPAARFAASPADASGTGAAGAYPSSRRSENDSGVGDPAVDRAALPPLKPRASARFRISSKSASIRSVRACSAD